MTVVDAVDFNGNGVAGCATCGWRGVATFLEGRRVAVCPVCFDDTDALVGELARAARPKAPRNALCPCGSDVKFKKCCGR